MTNTTEDRILRSIKKMMVMRGFFPLINFNHSFVERFFLSGPFILILHVDDDDCLLDYFRGWESLKMVNILSMNRVLVMRE